MAAMNNSHHHQTPRPFGRAFYEKIGSPKVVLAPMVDQSEFAWRMLTRSFIPDNDSSIHLLAYTPMFHSRIFRQDPKYRHRQFEATREASMSSSSSQPSLTGHVANTEGQESVGGETLFLDGNPSFDRPLTVQFCSNDPDDLLAASRHVAKYCDAVDLNLGCPQGIAKKGHYGAFLQEDWSLIHKLINTLHHELEVPVTAKMRILETREKTLEYAKMIIGAGASILTVHGRRREQKGHITGVADWSTIRYLRENLPRETVIFANGNILQHEDIEKCLAETGADAVMSAEGNLCDPSIFAPPPPVETETREYWQGRDGRGGYRMDAVVRRYLDIIYKYVLEIEPPQRRPLFIPGDETSVGSLSKASMTKTKRQLPDDLIDEGSSSGPLTKKQKQDRPRKKQPKTQSPNLLAMQPHLFSMLRPLVAKHTHVRDALAKARGGNMDAFEEVLRLTEIVTADALVKYEEGDETIAKHAEKPWKNVSPHLNVRPEESSSETVRKCWRPWWVCQPYVRPLPAEALAKGSITLSQKDKAQIQSEEAALRNDVGLSSTGTRTTVRPNDSDAARTEIPQEGLVCG